MTKPGGDKPKRERSPKLPPTPDEYLEKVRAILQTHYFADVVVLGCTTPNGQGTDIAFDPNRHTSGNMFAIGPFAQHMTDLISEQFVISMPEDPDDPDDPEEGDGDDTQDAEA